MNTEYKKLIEDATSKIADKCCNDCTSSFIEGAALPNALLLKAIDALENYSHELSTYEGVKPNLAMKTLSEIKQALTEAVK